METALIAGLGPVFVFCMLLLVIFLCKSQGYESGQKREDVKERIMSVT